MDHINQNNQKSSIITYKAEKVVDGQVVDTLEESFYYLHVPEFSRWKYQKAIDVLKPNGALIRFYINDVEQLLNC